MAQVSTTAPRNAVRDSGRASLSRCWPFSEKWNTERLELLVDDEGLATLERIIRHLRGGESHIHLMTDEWAGNELDVVADAPGWEPVHSLTLRRT